MPTGSEWKSRIVGEDDVAPASLMANPMNWRTHGKAQLRALSGLLTEVGWVQRVVVNQRTGHIVDGHARVSLAVQRRDASVPVVYVDLSPDEEKLVLASLDPIGAMADTDRDMLDRLLDEVRTDDDALRDLLNSVAKRGGDAADEDDTDGGKDGAVMKTGSLAETFLIPPFTVMNAREGWWQERKAEWLSIGMQSELGRGAKAYNTGDMIQKQQQHVAGVLMKSDSGNDPEYYFKKQKVEAKLGRSLTTEEFQRDYYDGPSTYVSGTSIFDPVLCELSYRWFSPVGGTVIDPFAGGSVRGIVASRLGRRYHGVELRAEQVAANEAQVGLAHDPIPTWHCGDSRDITRICSGVQADMIFSCPPYADLEVYSDDPADLSTLAYPDFRDAYFAIIASTATLLRPDRFAVFVVGDVRDKKGNYYNFVSDTIAAFRAAGMNLYNEAILVTAIGSLAMRVGKQFSATRKLGKTHQNVLVFLKGDAKRATLACGDVEVSAPDVSVDAGAQTVAAADAWGTPL